MGQDDLEVRREDQDKINKFSRLHQREMFLEEEMKGKEVGFVWVGFFGGVFGGVLWWLSFFFSLKKKPGPKGGVWERLWVETVERFFGFFVGDGFLFISIYLRLRVLPERQRGLRRDRERARTRR